MAASDQHISVDGYEFKISNLNKILYPRSKTTKNDVLHYYAAVAPLLILYAANRPATRKRWPDGVESTSFFEKNLPSYAPDWIATATLQHKNRLVRYPLINNPATLLWLVQGAALELHVPQWKYDLANDRRLPPDRLVIDLDPGEPAGLAQCAQVALFARDLLAADGLTDVHPVTSGGKGMHLYVSLAAFDPDACDGYARTLASRLAAKVPELALDTMARADRVGKVFIDWSQNNLAKTTITPYSMRGRQFPMVAAPRTWDELSRGVADPSSLQQLSYQQVLARVDSMGDLLAAQSS